jgi:tetratricopeptide (TPR) repeat protein
MLRTGRAADEWIRLVLLAIALVSLSISTARAQDAASRSAQVEGVVRDATGNQLAGASVTLQEGSQSTSAETKTNAAGAFVFPAVRPGTYRLRAEKSGFRDAIDDSVKLTAAEKKHCELVLRALVESSPASSESSSSSGVNASSAIALDDTPHFTVAGVTDSTGSGGHGSETRMRTGDALAKETLKLESGEMTAASGAALPEGGELARARDQLNRRLTTEKFEPKEEADLRRRLGDVDEKLQDPLAAVREYERAAALQPSEPNYFAWGAELLLHRAVVPATEVFGRGARLHPNSARMLAGLGAALYTSGSVDEAAQRLCAAADLAPAEVAPYLFLGQIQEASSTPIPCVEQELERLAASRPENAMANYYYSVALWKRERGLENPEAWRRVEDLLRKACAIDPKLDSAYLQLGNLYFARGEFKDALAAYEKSVGANPGGSESHYRLGLTYKRLGEDAKAEGEIAKYKELEKAEAAAVERQRRELRQFLVVLKDQPAKELPR